VEPTGEIAAFFGAIPVNRFLGFTLVACGEGGAEVALPVRAEYLQEGGVVHGGILSALADTAAVYALVPGLSAGRAMTSIEFKMNFLRPALPGRGDLAARSRVVQQGRTVGVCQVEVVQAGRPVALGTFTYLFFDRPPAAAPA
jgi:uncharacterized protein (TIGR00369 family)